MSKLAELRAKVAAQKSATNSTTSSSIFSFKNLKIGDSIHVRFVEDGEQNDFFWRERYTRSIQFNSLLLPNGERVANKVWVTIPAFNLKKGDVNVGNLPENYLYESSQDPIQQKIKNFYDGTEEGTALYNRFGRKRTYVLQGFVRAEGYETKLYRFILNPDLFNTIYSFIKDDEIDDMPTDPELGRTFIINVSKKIANINGKPTEVKDYSTSKWSSKITPLTADEQSYLNANGSFVLKNFIPSKPSTEQELAMLELYEASYNEQPYDVTRWGKIFRPDNIQLDVNGMIKDMNTKSVSNIPQEISNSTVSENIIQEPVVNTQQSITQQVMNQVQQTVAPTVTQTAPQLIAEHQVNISATDPREAVANILGKIGINPTN